MVPHFSEVLLRKGQAGIRRDGRVAGDQDVPAVRPEVVALQGELAAQETGDETKVPGRGLLPGDVRVGRTRFLEALNRGIIKVRSVIRKLVLGHVLVGCDIVVTHHTPGSLELEEAHRALQGLPEVLFGEDPAGGDTGEETPAVTGREIHGTIVAPGEFSQVFLLVVVVHAAEEVHAGLGVGVTGVVLVLGLGGAGEQFGNGRGKVIRPGSGHVAEIVLHLLVGGEGIDMVMVRERPAIADPSIQRDRPGVGRGIVHPDDTRVVVTIDILVGGAVVLVQVEGLAHGLGIREHHVQGGVSFQVQARGQDIQVDVQERLQGEDVPDGVAVARGIRHHDGGVVREAVIAGARKTVRIEGSRAREGGQEVREQVVRGGVAPLAVLLAAQDVQGHADGLVQLGVHIRDELVLVIPIRAVLVNGVLGHVLGGGVEGDPVGTAAQGNAVLGLSGPLLGGLAPPVGARVIDRIVPGEIVVQHFLRVGLAGLGVTLLGVILIHIGAVLISVQHLGDAGRLGKGVAAVVAHPDLSFGTTLGGHEDDAVRSAGAVNGGGSILQDGNALDVLGVQAGEVTVGDAVHHDERAGVAEGALTADEDHGVILARLAGTHVSDDAGRLAGQGVGEIGGGDLLEFLAVDGGDGTREGGLLLDTVADDDDFIEVLRVLGEDHVDEGTAVDRFLHGLVADGRECENRVRRNAQGVGAVRCRNGRVRGIRHDGDTDQGFSRRVGDRSPHLRLLRHGRDGRNQDGKGKETTFNVFHYVVRLRLVAKKFENSLLFRSKIAKQPLKNM